MSRTERSGTRLALLLAAGGGLLWTVGLTMVQPRTEAEQPGFVIGNNNDYWDRDLRIMAVIATVAAMMVAIRASGPQAAVVALGGLAWVLADAGLSRLNLAGPSALAAVGAGALLLVVVTWLALGRGRTVGPIGHRASVTIGAMCCAAVAPVAVSIESPTDVEPELNPSAIVTAVLLVAVALTAATAIGPTLTRARATVVGLVAVAAGAIIVGIRWAEPSSFQRQVGALLLAVLLLTAVHWLRWSTRSPVVYIGTAVVNGVLYPVGLIAALYVLYSMPFAAWLTALAGNRPVNAADTDFLLSLTGLAVGLLWGAVIVAFEQTRSPALVDSARSAA